MNELIRTLTQAWGPTSYEEGIRGVITRELDSLHMDCRMDALGNLIYCIPSPGKRLVMLLMTSISSSWPSIFSSTEEERLPGITPGSRDCSL
jgi:hypothetical protein